MNKQNEPIRKPIWLLGLTVLLLCVAGALAVWFHSGPPQSQALPETPANSNDKKSAPAGNAAHPIAPPRSATPALASGGRAPLSNFAPPPAPAPAPVSEESRRLVAALGELDITNGPMTPERLKAWRIAFQQITNAGPAAVPAIREFLAGNLDVNLQPAGGAGTLGQPSLRMSMLEALADIGSAEAVAALADTLATAHDPKEIAYLARNLEALAPGVYTQSAVDVARAALTDTSGRFDDPELAPLFEVLRNEGGAGAVDSLVQAKNSRPYYAAIALAGLADNAGVPALAQMADEGRAINRSAALQVLAEKAPDVPEAKVALLQEAGKGPIQDAIWMKMSALLGGEELRVLAGPDAGLPPIQGPVNTSYRVAGNQSFYSAPIVDTLSQDQIQGRIQLIDQFLALNPSAVAASALSQAKASLTGHLQTPHP